MKEQQEQEHSSEFFSDRTLKLERLVQKKLRESKAELFANTQMEIELDLPDTGDAAGNVTSSSSTEKVLLDDIAFDKDFFPEVSSALDIQQT